jgi:GAF domain
MNSREGELRTLYRLTHLLAMGTQRSSLLRTLLREALRLTGSRGGQVLLLKADRRTLLLHLGEGEAIADDQEVPADAPPWANVIREGKVVRLQSTRPVHGQTPNDCQVTLGIPLLARGDVLGILMLQDLSEIWAKHDRARFLEALADLAAHALRNDSLYRDLLRQKEELCTLIEASSDITASLDLDEAYKRVVRHAARLLRAQAAALMLVDDAGQTLQMKATYGGSQTWMQRPRHLEEASRYVCTAARAALSPRFMTKGKACRLRRRPSSSPPSSPPRPEGLAWGCRSRNGSLKGIAGRFASHPNRASGRRCASNYPSRVRTLENAYEQDLAGR